MIIIGLIAFLFIVLLTCLLLIAFIKLYVFFAWQWDEEGKMFEVKVKVLRMVVYKKTVDLTGSEKIKSTDSETNWKEVIPLGKEIIKMATIEKVETETVVATNDPSFTAHLYVVLQTLKHRLLAQYPRKDFLLSVGADFEQESLESFGECMISMKLSKTIKEINKMKKLMKGANN
ncbi:hypothetical protein MUN88_13775 [Gracilibacillus caseinilyticus]|uniref:Uncharacterized protein n=1 Tax=Gracilibacillus caseinilyticus TaxID=2932256 RepID=A0ABY4ESH7_9BACI|nr:hypothetical protein [Gracilibacillus caseinilyticus]UOQ47143.1 hypothetical protein MUN88_13775 [Gracilibacillus caseinilyticus]